MKPGTKKLSALELAPGERRVEAGSLEVRGSVTLAEGAELWVLGDLKLGGGLWSPFGIYSLVVVGGSLRAKRVGTSGELLVFCNIEVETLWGEGNDHSTYAENLTCTTYLALDRFDKVGKSRVATSIKSESAAKRLFPWCVVADEDARLSAARDYFLGSTSRPAKRRASPKVAEQARAWLTPAPAAEVKRNIATYGQQWRDALALIRKYRLKQLAPDVAAHARYLAGLKISFGIVRHIELLGELGAADELEGLLNDRVRGLRGAAVQLASAFGRAGRAVDVQAGRYSVMTRTGQRLSLNL